MESECRIATVVFAEVSGLPAEGAATATAPDQRIASVVFADVGGDVRRDATLVGATVDVASRLKDVSPAGTVWGGGAGQPRQRQLVGDRQFVRIVFDMTSLRTVEQRRYLARASTSGPSGIVDPFGRVQVATAPGTQDVIAGTVRPLHGLTPYARLGDAFGIGCAVVVAVALARRTLRRDAAA